LAHRRGDDDNRLCQLCTEPAGPKEASVPAEGAELGRAYVAPDMSRNCAGLSDRQTERACKEGYPTQHSNDPNAMGLDRGGQTDDQAS
jgi:hypothetical protein